MLISAIFRYKSGDIDYLDSDATWHTLLTIEAYSETPVSQHLFLPIVSLGSLDDKNIPWGATVPDKNGNYYYTSFSPAGYFLPWIFIKVLKLPVNESSLYIFNTALFITSTALLVWLLAIVYRDNRDKILLCYIGGITYAFVPELLHGMGIVYWHQSVMQVTLLLQIIAYYKFAMMEEKKYKWFFYLFALINPYIEWTGYVANVGFALAELIRNYKYGFGTSFGKAFRLGIITLFSFGIFSFHYLLRIDKATFVLALKNRFMARNVTTNVNLTDVFGGYYKSFLYLWFILLIFVVWSFTKRRSVEIKNGILLLITAFPIIENIIMKQHALAYTYDRMKAVFVLIIIMCEFVRNILECEKDRFKRIIILAVVLLGALFNFNSYQNDTSYVWNVSYKENNNIMAEYVTIECPNGLYASGSYIRGYMNLLFGKGIYENISMESAIQIAKDKQKSDVVYVTKEGYEITDISIYSIEKNETQHLSVVDNNVVERPDVSVIRLADLTDSNWTKGCSNTSNIILFNRSDSLLIDVLVAKKIICQGEEYEILSVDFDDLWIRVETDKNPKNCQYPTEIILQ